MQINKSDILGKFREYADKELKETKSGTQKEKARCINQKIKLYCDQLLERCRSSSSDKTKTLENILLITYASYVIMLEYRNKVWPYDYMAFSRRIGELWEPFCKLPFHFSITDLELISPLNFDDVQNKLKGDIREYIAKLPLLQAQKEELINLYNTPWELLDSGEIRLDLDLHFKFNNIRYNCDFKSGFSSNEKGNTNRLLLVASIYSKINQHGKNILFVRQPEDENNHYLQTLKHSSYWEVFCSNDCYEEIKNFTGYDLRSWLDKNADWENDISKEFKDYLYAQSLIKYLTW